MSVTCTSEPLAPEREFSPARNLAPLVVDVAVPLSIYFLLHSALGVGLITSLAASSIVPALRTIGGFVRDRSLNPLAALMLAVNLAGIALSFLTGNARLMFAKDSVISSVIAFSILASVRYRRPLLSAGLEPFITKGNRERTEAWNRLGQISERFGRLERRFSLIWGAALLAECTARVIGAFTLPVSTMSWLSPVLLLAGIGFATIVAGGAAAGPLEELVDQQVAI